MSVECWRKHSSKGGVGGNIKTKEEHQAFISFVIYLILFVGTEESVRHWASSLTHFYLYLRLFTSDTYMIRIVCLHHSGSFS